MEKIIFSNGRLYLKAVFESGPIANLWLLIVEMKHTPSLLAQKTLQSRSDSSADSGRLRYLALDDLGVEAAEAPGPIAVLTNEADAACV